MPAPARRPQRLRPARRLATLGPALVVVALVASACRLSPYAAIVNGQVITPQDLNTELDAIAGNEAYVQSLETGSQPIQVLGQGAHSYDTRFADDVLSRQISFALIHQELVRRHLGLSPSDLALARTDVVGSLGGPSVLSAFPKSYQDTLVRRSAELTALESSVAGVGVGTGALRQYYDAHRSQFVESCVSIIAVASQAAAAQVITQVQAGADFAQLASQVSQDTATKASGGQVGCGLPDAFASRYGTPLSLVIQGLSSGQLGAPTDTPVGWVVAKVTAQRPLSFAQATPGIRSALLAGSGNSLLSLVGHLTKGASVSVDPRYGRFSAQGGLAGLVPPAPPPAADLALPNGTSSTGLGSAGSAAPGG